MFPCLLKLPLTNMEVIYLLLQSALFLHIYGSQFMITSGELLTIARQPGHQKNESWESGIHKGNPREATDLYVGSLSCILGVCVSPTEGRVTQEH